MKKLLLILSFLLISVNSFGATCSTTSRTPYTAGQVLTSSALNADFNQLVTKSNAMDGGCITDSSLEPASLDSSFDALKNGIHQGCSVTYSDANTVSVDKCLLSVGGIFVKTAAATTVTMGCSGCSAEVVSTTYYVYAKPSSTSTALALTISTTAPLNTGLDVSGNRVLAKFYNDASSNIKQLSIEDWITNKFQSKAETFTWFYDNGALSACTASCTVWQADNHVLTMVASGTGSYIVTPDKPYKSISCAGSFPYLSAQTGAYYFQGTVSSFTLETTVSGSTANTYGSITCTGFPL